MAAVKCPKCSATIDAGPDELGFIVCGKCGAKLRTKTGMKMTVQGSAAAVSPPASAAPTPASWPPRPAPSPGLEAGDVDTVLARLDGPNDPNMTLLPGTPVPRKAPAPSMAGSLGSNTIEAVLVEIRALRKTQDEILSLLRSRPAVAGRPEADLGPQGASEDERTQPLISGLAKAVGGKTVLLIDDDPQTRQAAVASLQRAQVGVKTALDGNGGLAAIAMEKPDVIVLELALGGSMPGKDLINLIKATMEWVDIPIVLYTRGAVGNEADALLEQSADEIVAKGPGGPETLARKVTALLARG